MSTSATENSQTNGAAAAQTNGAQSSPPEREWKEVQIDVPWGVVAGKWYGDQSEQPVLAIHGWQDNAGTFDRLLPLLPANIPIFAIDLPGHGHSSPYPTGMIYYLFWDGITLIRRIAKKYRWPKVKLLGHSLGAALSFMYAATYPDEVDQIVCIDLYGPPVRCLKKNADLLGPCIDKALVYETLPKSKQPCYDYDEMVAIVTDAYSGSIDRRSAEVLMVRGMKPAESTDAVKRYYFSRDLRLKVSMKGMFSLEQVLVYAERVKCHVLNIRGVPGMKFDNEDVYPMVVETMRKNANVQYVEVEGTHHLHLVTPERISAAISSFLLDPEADVE